MCSCIVEVGGCQRTLLFLRRGKGVFQFFFFLLLFGFVIFINFIIWMGLWLQNLVSMLKFYDLSFFFKWLFSSTRRICLPSFQGKIERGFGLFLNRQKAFSNNYKQLKAIAKFGREILLLGYKSEITFNRSASTKAILMWPEFLVETYMFQQGREHLAARGELVLGPRKKGKAKCTWYDGRRRFWTRLKYNL